MSIAIGAAIAVLTGIGAGLGIGKNLILGCALAEATAIYGFLIAILLIFMN